ncbi:hypothetical protein GCM10008922_42340 [Faecalicatena contorta]|uniref:sensor domain-containing diguanylate cyclase n=1 Tax=Faecalicatena contorta TaxID=39482 RepID=UPI0031E4411F
MIEKDKIYPVIVDESENIVYISDPETYEVIYLNQAMRDTLDLKPGEDYQGRLCYELLQGQSAPCQFCTNGYLMRDKFYTWKHYNEKLGRHFSLRDKLIEIDGHLFRLEICVDITESEELHKNLERKLSIEETLVQCIHMLSENQDIDMSINGLLRIIGEFFQADRSYIFECNYEEDILVNTYEWCNEGVIPQKENLQRVPRDVTDHWMELFRNNGAVYLPSVSSRVDEKAPEAAILSQQGIGCLMAAPIWEAELQKDGEKTLYGFIGVDDPTRGVEHIKLLQSVAYFIYNDVQKRRMIMKLGEMGRIDALTGLGNRNFYMEKLKELSGQKQKSMGVVFCDINGLKYANDHFGHAYGDKMIRSVAQGVKQTFPENAYRIGGDEFIALYVNGTKEEFYRRLEALKKYAENECICDFSMGVNFGEGTFDVEELIGGSDNMMYLEKQTYYGSMVSGKPAYHKAVARQLVREIETGGFEVFLQPKICLETGEMVGAEALLRQKGEDGGYYLPEQFITLYEKEGVIPFLDCFAFEEVCGMLQEWMAAGGKPVPVSVNFSRISLMKRGIVQRLAEIRERYGVPEQLLVLEITESISKMEPSALQALIDELKKYHFVVSLDDYGYQYSNLAILSNMDFVELKLDRSLVENLKDNPKARVLVENSIEMCRQLNQIISTAEGIEDDEQLDILKGFKCNMGQGFLFSHPLPRDEFFEKFGKTAGIPNGD